jgi:hypothetical protein
MRFLTFFIPDQIPTGPPDAEHMTLMNKLVDEQTKAGTLIATGAIASSANGAVVSLKDGKFAVSNGAPQVPQVGFAILQGSTKDEVIEATKKFLAIAGDGKCEVRPLIGPPPQ